METVTDINRWLLNPVHRLLGLAECRSLRRRKAFGLCLLGFVRSPRRFSNLGFRLLLPRWFVRHCLVYHNGKVSAALLEDRFLRREDSGEKLSGQKPYKGIDPGRKRFLSCNCRDICGRICRIVFWEENLTVVRKLYVLYELAGPFSRSMKVYWPRFKGRLKSIPIIFSHNLLYLFSLQRFSKTSTRQ